MSDAAGRHDRARDLLGRTRSVDADGADPRPVEPSRPLGSPVRAGHPGLGAS